MTCPLSERIGEIMDDPDFKNHVGQCADCRKAMHLWFSAPVSPKPPVRAVCPHHDRILALLRAIFNGDMTGSDEIKTHCRNCKACRDVVHLHTALHDLEQSDGWWLHLKD